MLNEVKVFKDNVLGYVKVKDQLIWDLINTKEFQRLRRIRHLGGISMVFHSAEHSRFTHCLGVYEITRRMIKSVEGIELSEYERILVLCSALLHDLGHGPLSHAFETISVIDHEEMTKRIIIESTEVNQVLKNFDPKLVDDIVKVISHEYENEIVTAIISSQIDADRLDYLVRDSYNTGVVYGITDLERLFRMSKVVDNKICFKLKALKEIEIYFLSRLCMYEQIYFHPNGRSYELLFQNALFRYKELLANNYEFKHNYSFIEKIELTDIDIEDFLLLDDATIMHYLKCFMQEEDEILSDLSRRFINRDLFKFESYYQEGEICSLSSQIEKLIEKAGLAPKYYLASDTMSTKFYRFDETIYVCDEDKVFKLEEVSEVIKKLESEKRVTYIYFPKEFLNDAQRILDEGY